jgi:hypothetical protein
VLLTKVNMIEGTKIVHYTSDWVTIVFFIVFALLVFIKILHNEKLYYTSTFFLFKKHLQIQFNQEKNLIFNPIQWLFFCIQLLSLALILFFFNEKFTFYASSNKLTAYIYIFIFVFLYFLVRYFIGLILSQVFLLKKTFNQLFYFKVNYFNNLILWVLPFFLIAYFSPIYNEFLFNLAFIVFAFLLIIRYVLLISNNKKLIINDLFYFILYLCALEIAPLILIFKLTI